MQTKVYCGKSYRANVLYENLDSRLKSLPKITDLHVNLNAYSTMTA